MAETHKNTQAVDAAPMMLDASSPMLVMTILCKNEVDIIACNIRTHAALGVDAFVVMDNGSTDGTRELLASLAEEYPIHIVDQASPDYKQSQWMTELAGMAKTLFNAHWVISNDADEFWLPQHGRSIKALLEQDAAIATVQRSNMLLTEASLEPDYDFTQTQYRVQHPIMYDKHTQMHDDGISMLFPKISPKVIVKPKGLIRMHGGNHRADHWAMLWSRTSNDNLRVYHYPIRSYAQFEANIKHRQALLNNASNKMGYHYKRWVTLYQDGQLAAEYERMVCHANERAVLEKYGVITVDRLPSELLVT